MKQTQHHAGNGSLPRVQGMVFDTSTPVGRAALEQYRRTGVAPPPPKLPTSARPKHPGVAAMEAEAATQAAFPFPGMQVIHGPAPDPDIELFTPEDAEQALKIFDASAGIDRHRAILEVMLFALRIAAINLDVHA